MKKISNEQIQKWSDELVNLVERTIERESKNIENYVNQLRSQNHIIENIGQEYTKKAISKYITREVMKKINKIVSRKIITKAGEKSLTSFARLAPIASVPIGAAYDYFTTVAIGKAAKKYYKTEKSVPPGEGGLGGRGCHLILRCSAGLGYPGIDKSNPSGDGGGHLQSHILKFPVVLL